MRLRVLALFLVVAFLAIGCPGNRPPESPKKTETNVNRPVHLSKSGLGFRLSNADESEGGVEERKVAPSSPLGKDDATKLLSRLPKLVEQPDDSKNFSMRDKSIPAPRPGKTVNEAFPPPPTAAATPTAVTGPLSVERFAPEGPVTLAPNVSVTFSEPMVPVSSVSDVAKENLPVRLSPEPAGKWQWLGTRTLVFQPEKRLPMATSYTVTVPEGTKAQSGKTLAKAVQWTFVTPPPVLKSSWPGGSSVELKPVLFAEFDQQIDPAKMLTSIELSSARGNVPVRLATQDEIDADDAVRHAVERASNTTGQRWLAFVPDRALPNATRFNVRIKQGALGAEGPLPTTKDQSYGFETFGPFAVTSSRCGWSDHCAPLDPFQISFSNPIDRTSFDPALVSVSPEIPGMKIEAYGSEMTLSGRTKGRTKYTVTIGAALADTHGQTLGTAKTVTFDVGSAEPRLFDAERDMVVLDPASPKHYVVYTINEPELRARIYAVKPEDWRRYAAYTREWERPRKLTPPGRLVFDKTVRPKGAADELTATPIDLSPALQGKFGHAVVVIESTRPPKKYENRRDLSIWVQSTELGVQAFVEADRLTGWVTKLEDGSPLDDVEISLLGGSGSAKTKSGLAILPIANGYPLVAKKGNDVAFITEDWIDASTFSNGGAVSASLRWLVFDDRGTYKPGEEVHVKGWVRRVDYGRGGDLGAIDAAGKEVAFVVRDPRGAELTKGSAIADAQGSFDFAFKLPGNANLGTANVQLTWPDRTLTGTTDYHSFEIQEFRKPEFEVKTTTSEGPNFVGGHAVATVTASYYAGGGLPSAPVHWTVSRTTTSFQPPNRSEYHFGPEPKIFWGYVARGGRFPGGDPDAKTETWNATTNAQGVHRLRFDFDPLEKAYPMNLALTSSVEDVNRQSWAGRGTMLVHPSNRYVGVRLVKNFVRMGENIDVDVVATDLDGKTAPNRPITVQAARLDYVSKGLDYEEKEVDVQTCDVTSGGDAPQRCTFKTTEGGRYRITATVIDEQGRRNQSTIATWVTGGDRPDVRSVDQDKVTVIADKNEYLPGETATVLVVAPFFPAEGVLTVRRQGVVHLERFSMRESSQTLKVKLDEAMIPNVSIRVDLVGAASRRDAHGDVDPKLPKQPAFAAGSASVKILPTSRTLAVKAQPKSPTLAPGSSTTIDVEVKDPSGRPARDAQVAVVVVDEAVLALSGYKAPDPLAIFYSDRSEDVHEIENRSRVLLGDPNVVRASASDGRASGFGSGGGAKRSRPMAAPAPMASAAPLMKAEAMEMAKDSAGGKGSVVGGDTSPIDVRSDFASLALFAPRVKTDGAGRATVSVKVPDNLTRYRVMAVASSGQNFFGSNESTITARLPLMVRPSAPRFLNFGDRFELPVVVQNQTDKAIEVGIVVRGSNATVEDTNGKRVTVAANDRVEVRFPAKTVKAGTARFQIGVAAPGFSDASQIELPVYTPATTEAFATYGEIDNGAAAQPVKMPGNVFTEFGGLEVTTSSTQLQALTDAVLYLVKYPFECNEQIASRVVSVAALRDVLTAFKAEGMPSPAELEASMKADFAKLARTQNANGGWGFWQEQPWPYLSIHVAHALVRAKEKGYEPNAETLRRAGQYLRNVESYIPGWYGEDARRAIIGYALYVRNRMKDADPARAKRLIKEAGGVDKLPIEAVGWIWPTISADKSSTAENEAIRRHVANRVTETAGAAHFVSNYADSNWVLLQSDRRADGVLLEALIGDQPSSTLIPKLVKGLLGHRKAGKWTNTQENAFILLALDRYFATYEKVTPDFVARVWLGDRFAGQHVFKGRTTEYSNVQVPMNWLAANATGTQNLVVGKDGPGRLYYRIGMQYAPSDLKLDPADNGFVVSRTYEGAENPADVRRAPDGAWHVKLGSKVRVRVSMVARSRRYHVALVDPLPAGLEPMNPALAVTGEIPKDPKAEEEAAKTGGRYWYWTRTWYEHQNMRDERVEAFTSLLFDGVWDYTYVATATTPGNFVVPPPKAEEMYAPETFGRGATDRVIVE